MFYVNNKEIKGLYIGDRPYNYIVSGFSKIIPEDRNVDAVNLNLAFARLNSYRVEYGNLEDGYANAPIKRIDKPDYNNIYHTPFTYYDGNNIVPTKNVPIVITNGFYAFVQGNVYNDININGNYTNLAFDVDFQGKTIRTNSEYSEYDRYLSDNVFTNCNNFTAELKSKYSSGYTVLYNCNNFKGNFKFEGNSDNILPGLPAFLMECKDGKFNIDVTNMRGGGSDTNVYDRLDFECIQYCDNVDLNITGSGWQSWPQSYAFSYNCNINTFNIIAGFGGLHNSNVNVVLPKDSTPDISGTYELLRGSDNCNYKLVANDCNLYNFYGGVGGSWMFENLNDCNLNLLLNNSVLLDKSFGSNINNSNIEFYNAGLDATIHEGWYGLQDCNIQGNVVKSDYNARGFIEYSNNLNLNLNVYNTNKIDVLRFVDNSKGNIVMGKESHIKHSSSLNINTSLGNLQLYNVSNSNFKLNGTQTALYSSNKVYINGSNIKQISESNNINADFYFNGSLGSKWVQRSNNINIYTYGNIDAAGHFIDNSSNVTLRHPNNNHLLNTGTLENIHYCNIYGNVYVSQYFRCDHINASGASGVNSGVQFSHCNNMNMRVSKGNVGLYNVRDSYIQCSRFPDYNSYINSDCSNITLDTLPSKNYGKQISGNCFFSPGFVFFDNSMNISIQPNLQQWSYVARVTNGSNYSFNSIYPWTKINDVTCNMNNYGNHWFRPDGPVGSVTFNCHMYGPPGLISSSSRWDSEVTTVKGSGGIQFLNSMFSTGTFEVYSPASPYIYNSVAFMNELAVENNTFNLQMQNSLVAIMDSMYHTSAGSNTLNLSVHNSLLFLGFNPNNSHRINAFNSTVIVPNSFNKQSIENQIIFGGGNNTNVYTMKEWILRTQLSGKYEVFVNNVMSRVGWNVNSPFPMQSRYAGWALNPGHDNAMTFLKGLQLR